MRTLKLNQKNFEKTIIELVKLIKKGKILVLPTDTVYGLICDATNKISVERIFKIKKRLKKKPFPLFVKNLKMAKEITKIDKKQEKFLKSIWPGKVTVVLKRKKTRMKLYGLDKKTIATRIPKCKLIIELIKKTNRLLTETSVNVSGEKPLTKIQEVINQFRGQKNKPDLIVDSGNLRGKPSKVIDLTKKKLKILRV